jgi:hypothetical protein
MNKNRQRKSQKNIQNTPIRNPLKTSVCKLLRKTSIGKETKYLKGKKIIIFFRRPGMITTGMTEPLKKPPIISKVLSTPWISVVQKASIETAFWKK